MPIPGYSNTVQLSFCCHVAVKCALLSFADGDVVDVSFHGDARQWKVRSMEGSIVICGPNEVYTIQSGCLL